MSGDFVTDVCAYMQVSKTVAGFNEHSVNDALNSTYYTEQF